MFPVKSWPGINFGQGANGLTVNASVNRGKGSETGNGVSHTETTVSAGNNLTINSRRDTTLTGAQVSGEKVILDVGRNLTLTSEQDSDDYDAKQQNASAGASVAVMGGGGSASASVSRDKMHSSYDSVQEQSGIFAGKGGFDITVGEHTQLDGAVIGSTATSDNNRLDTGTIGFSDIRNSAEYEVEHQSAGVSTGGGVADGGVLGDVGKSLVSNLANGLLVGVNGSGSDSSTTKSAVSKGTIIVRDTDKQTQDVSQLSRDVENANPGLVAIFDKEKEQRRLQEAQLIGEIGVQVGDIARTQGQIIATRDANGKMKNVSPEQLKTAEADWRKANPGKTPTADDISGQAYQTFYNQAFNDSGFGTGGKVQQAIQAATAAVQGLAGGDLAKAIAGGASPYLAEVIHDMTTTKGPDGKDVVNVEANLMAHAVLGAVVAQINGNSALAGAAGATTGEFIAQQLYPGVDRDKLSEDQKQTISALATLASGLAGGVAGDSTADVVAGAQAGKNSSENNNLSLPSGLGNYGLAVASWNQYAQDNNLTPEQTQEGMNRIATGEGPSWGTEYKVKTNEKLRFQVAWDLL